FRSGSRAEVRLHPAAGRRAQGRRPQPARRSGAAPQMNALYRVLLFALVLFPLFVTAQERGQVRLGHNRAWNNSALIIGISEGYFQRAGVTMVERSLSNAPSDAAPIDAMLSVKAQQQFPGQTKILFTYADVTKQALGNLHVNGLILNFGDAFIERDRETAMRFMEGYLRAIKDVHADPKKVLGQWAAASKDDTIRSLEAPPTLPADGKIYLDAFQFDAEQALKFGYIKQPMDLRQAIDHSLLDEAARRIKQ